MSTIKSDEISSEMLTLIAARLRPVCPDIPEVEFQHLVRDVARVKVKYDADAFMSPTQRNAQA